MTPPAPGINNKGTCTSRSLHVCKLSCIWLFETPMNCSLPGFSVQGFSQWEYLEGLPFPPPGVKLMSPTSSELQEDSLLLSHREAPPEVWRSENVSCSVVSDSLQPHGLYSPWNSRGQNTGVDSLSLLQGIFLGSNPVLPHCRQILYHPSQKPSSGLFTLFSWWSCFQV